MLRSRIRQTCPRRWTRATLLPLLQAAGAAQGRWWTMAAWDKAHQRPHSRTILNIFDTWAAAWAAAGYPVDRHWTHQTGQRFTQAGLIAGVRAAGAGQPLTVAAYNTWRTTHGGPSVSTLVNRLGGWSKVLETAGLPPRSRVTAETVRTWAATWSTRHAVPLTRARWEADPARPCSAAHAAALVGSWRTVRAAAGPRHSPSAAVAVLLQQPRECLTSREQTLAAALRAGATLAEAGALLGISRERVRQIAHRAGRGSTSPTARRERQRAAALVVLRQWVVRHQRRPTPAEWTTRRAHPGIVALNGLFGSWDAAWDAADAPPHTASVPVEQWSAATAARFMRTWAVAHGRWPSRAEWARLSHVPSLAVIQGLWGSWRAGWRTAAPEYHQAYRRRATESRVLSS